MTRQEQWKNKWRNRYRRLLGRPSVEEEERQKKIELYKQDIKERLDNLEENQKFVREMRKLKERSERGYHIDPEEMVNL